MYVFSIICFCDQKKALKRKQKQKQKQKKKKTRETWKGQTLTEQINNKRSFCNYLSNIIMQQYQEMRKRQMMVLFNRTYQNKQSIRSIKRAIAE